MGNHSLLSLSSYGPALLKGYEKQDSALEQSRHAGTEPDAARFLHADFAAVVRAVSVLTRQGPLVATAQSAQVDAPGAPAPASRRSFIVRDGPLYSRSPEATVC
jgi:hypothetical protein